MRTALFTSCSFAWTYQPKAIPSHNLLAQSSLENGACSTKSEASSREYGVLNGEAEKVSGILKRRSVVLSGASLVSSAVLGFPGDGLAVIKQGLLAGRVPGLSEPDEQGWYPSIPACIKLTENWKPSNYICVLLYKVYMSVWSPSLNKCMLRQVGGRTADQMRSPEGTALVGALSSLISSLFLKVGKR